MKCIVICCNTVFLYLTIIILEERLYDEPRFREQKNRMRVLSPEAWFDRQKKPGQVLTFTWHLSGLFVEG